MTTQDSLSLLLTKIRNGFKYRSHCVMHKNTKMANNVVQLLYLHGYLRGFRVNSTDIVIYPKFNDLVPVLRTIKRISRPGFKKYINVAKLHDIQMQQPCFIVVSTTKGLMSHHAAVKSNLGGEFLFIIY